MNDEGYQHIKVNYKLNFKDPINQAHTNGIESLWRATKAVTSSCRRKRAHIPGNLTRYMFYKHCADLKVERRKEFCRLAGSSYNLLNYKKTVIVENFKMD